MKTNKMALIVASAITLFISCQKSDESTQVSTTTLSNQEVVTDFEMDNLVNDVSNITEDQFGAQLNMSSKNSKPYKSMLPACVKISTELTNEIWTRTIDFGSEGCTLGNGNVLKGKIILTFKNNFGTSEQKITHTLEGFYHNDKKIEGTQTITRTLQSTPLLAEIHPVTTLELNLKITLADGKTHERTGTRVREMVEGYATLENCDDNVFLVWGDCTTIAADGSTYTTSITDPLRFVAACKLPYPTKGMVLFTKTSADGLVKKEAQLDFGNGDCDKLATITINGETKEIELKK